MDAQSSHTAAAGESAGGDTTAQSRSRWGASGQPSRHREQFAFFGDGGEYFRIWIVNVLLTALTLGIYSAWAKVRTTQYFYRNARVAGASFEYHASPLAILKGRIIAAVVFVSYYALTIVNPLAALALALALMAVLPWAIVRALRFRLYNTSYRGLRFRFTGSTADAYRTFLLYPIGTMLTFGLLGPMFMHRMKKFVHENSTYGTTPFTFDAGVASYYRVYMATLGVALGLAACVAAIAFPLYLAATPIGDATPSTFNLIAMALTGAVAVLGYITVVVGAWAFMTAAVQNLTWNSTQLGPHRFEVQLQATQLARLMVNNWFAIVFTLGLYKPFAQVKLAQFVMDAAAVHVLGDLNDFVAGAAQAPSAFGEEAVEMFDIELAV